MPDPYFDPILTLDVGGATPFCLAGAPAADSHFETLISLALTKTCLFAIYHRGGRRPPNDQLQPPLLGRLRAFVRRAFFSLVIQIRRPANDPRAVLSNFLLDLLGRTRLHSGRMEVRSWEILH